MSAPSSVDLSARAPLSPVTSTERIVALDVLRGLALLGVVVANVWLWFSGLFLRFPGYRDELRGVSLDAVVFFAIAILVSGKAISTFSFLFGHGFAIQMMRADARGRSIVGTYSRRLFVLLLIGLLHVSLLWYGDVLVPYAILGFVLILFRKRSDRALLRWVVVLMVGLPLLMGAAPLIARAFGVEAPSLDMEAMAARHAATLSVFQSGDYSAIVRENLVQAGKLFYFGRKALFLMYILGLFLLGLYVGRRRMFEQVEGYRPLFRRIAIWGIPIGIAAGIVVAWMQMTFEPAEMFSRPALALAAVTVSTVSMLPLAAGYVSAVTLLLQSPRWSRRLSVFAPVGRMALTNYLSQTVVMVLLFNGYGAGLIGRTGPALGLVIAVLVFAAQTMVSAVWLRHYRFGPMEWLWRSLTYGRMQPMRRQVASEGPLVALP